MDAAAFGFLGITYEMEQGLESCGQKLEEYLVDCIEATDYDQDEKNMLEEIFIAVIKLCPLQEDNLLQCWYRRWSLVSTLSSEFIDGDYTREMVSGYDLFPLIQEAVEEEDLSALYIGKRYMIQKARWLLDAGKKNLKSLPEQQSELIEDMSRIISEDNRSLYESIIHSRAFMETHTLRDIVDLFDETIEGQHAAKKSLSLALYHHVRRIAHPSRSYPKENFLLFGPSGSGKTELIRRLAEISPLPVVRTDSTSLVSTGFHGGDSIVERVRKLLNRDRSLVNGIIIFDEADKIIMPNFDSNGDNVNAHLQGDFLAVVEDGKVLSSGHSVFPTENITFGLVGAFQGLLDEPEETHVRGFCRNNGSEEEPHEEVVSLHEVKEKLLKFGMIPEMMRRFPRVMAVRKLCSEDYVHLLKRKNGPLERMLTGLGFSVSFDREALKLLAEEVQRLDLGVSGIAMLLQDVIDSVEYEYEMEPHDNLNEKRYRITKARLLRLWGTPRYQ